MSDIFQTITGGFFDSVNKDRLYSADQMNMPYKKIVSDGIFSEGANGGTAFKVASGSGMTVSVAPGNALIGGKWCENEDDVSVVVSANTSEAARIDSIILRLDNSVETRAIGIVYRQGGASAPSLESATNIKEFRLANINVAVDAASITEANIVDTRGTAECPWVSSVVSPTEEQLVSGVEGFLEDNPSALDNPVKASVEEYLDEHPEIIGTVPDGSVTETKLAEDVSNKLVTFQKSQIAMARRTICGDNLHYLQGGCYVDSLGHYVLAFAPIDENVTDTTVLVELDTDFATVINTVASVNYGHCNDLTYNAKTDRIYASSTGHIQGSAYAGKVIAIDPATLAVASTVNKITNVVSAISYDAENDVYYTSEVVSGNDMRQIYKYDAEFNRIGTLGDAYIIEPAAQVGQCSFIYKGQFVLVSESNAYGHKVWFNTFGESPQIWQTDNFAYYESEAVVERNGVLYLLSIKGTAYIYVYELSAADHIINHDGNEIYSLGTLIIKNEDLDNITQTGHYYETTASANTVTNTPYPMTAQFSLDVIHTGYSGLMQIFTSSLHEVFVRSYTGTWGPWISLRSGYKYRGKTINFGNWYTAGFVTTGGRSFRFSIPMEIESSVGTAAVASGSIRMMQGGNVILDTTGILTAFETVTVTKTDAGLSFEFITATALENVVNSDAVGIQLYSMVVSLGA